MAAVIDAHLHVWDGSAAGKDPGPMSIGYSPQSSASVELFLDYMDEAGVAKASAGAGTAAASSERRRRRPEPTVLASRPAMTPPAAVASAKVASAQPIDGSVVDRPG